MPFFNRKKSTINSILIPDFGWIKEKSTKKQIQWINPDQPIALTLNYFDAKPDLPSLKEIDTLRHFYRKQLVGHQGGLIEVEYIELDTYNAIRTLFKIPQKPSGTVYLASLTIPFKTCSYVIKIQAPEIGRTGIRDSIIADRLLKEGIIYNGENGYENWFSDPYDTTFKNGTLMNTSEDAIYDTEFENHPLTQARKLISQIESEIEFKPELQKKKELDFS